MSNEYLNVLTATDATRKMYEFSEPGYLFNYNSPGASLAYNGIRFSDPLQESLINPISGEEVGRPFVIIDETFSFSKIFAYHPESVVSGGNSEDQVSAYPDTGYVGSINDPIPVGDSAGNRLYGIPLLFSKKNIVAPLEDFSLMSVDIRHPSGIEVETKRFTSASREVVLMSRGAISNFGIGYESGDRVILSRKVYGGLTTVTCFGSTYEYLFAVHEMKGQVINIEGPYVTVAIDSGYLDVDMINIDFMCPDGQEMSVMYLGEINTETHVGGNNREDSLSLGAQDYTYIYSNRTAPYKSRIPEVLFSVPVSSSGIKMHINILRDEGIFSHPSGFVVIPKLHRA